MADRRIPEVVIENAQIVFRNFAGKADKYNREGDRNFAVILDEETANRMMDDGWNIKTLKAREDVEDSVDRYYVQVSVSFKVRAPRIVMLTSQNRSMLDEGLVSMLDDSVFETVDLILTPYQWEVNGDVGIKAYLKSMYVTIEEDYLQKKYGVNEEGI